MTRPYFDYLKGKWVDGYKPKGLEFSNLMDQLNDMDNVDKNNTEMLQAVLQGEFDEAALQTDFQNKLETAEATYAPRLTNLEEEILEKADANSFSSTTDSRFDIPKAKSIKGISTTANSDVINGNFTSDMNGKMFYLFGAGDLLANTSLYKWERSPVVGTFTYVSSTEGKISENAKVTLSNTEIIIGEDASQKINEALDEVGSLKIPTNTDYILSKEIILKDGQKLEGSSSYTSRIFSGLKYANGIVSVFSDSPVVKNLSYFGNSYGKQPPNVTPEHGNIEEFLEAFKDSGCGITFANVKNGLMEDVFAYHCGGDMVTENRNGIAGIYLTFGCKGTVIRNSRAYFCRNGINEDSYFGIDDLEKYSARDNLIDACITEYNVFGQAIDSGSLSRGAVINNPISNYNVQWGVGVNASKYVTINNPRCSFNGSNYTNCGIQIYGTSAGVISEHITINNPTSFANGTHGIKVSEYVNDWKVIGGIVARNFRHGFYANLEANNGVIDNLTSRRNAQGNDSPGEYDGIKITSCKNVRISAQVIDDGDVKSHNYGIRANGTSDNITIDDNTYIEGFLEAAIELVGENSISGSKSKRERVLLNKQGIKGENFNRQVANGNLSFSSGEQRASLISFLSGDIVKNLMVHVDVVGNGLTLGKICLWKKNGELLYTSAELSSQFNVSTGIIKTTLTNPFKVKEDDVYYIGVVFFGGTPPQLLRGTSGITGYNGQFITGFVPPSVGNTGKTDATDLTINSSGNAIWVAWS